MRYLAALALGTLLVGCAPQRVIIRPGDPAPRGGGSGGPAAAGTPQVGGPTGPGAVGNSGAAEEMRRAEAYLNGQGFSRVGPVARQQNLLTNGLMAYAITGAPDHCYVAVATADGGADLNLVVLDPMGHTAAHDVRPDAHPWVSFCPAEAGRYLARIQMASGSSEYYYALFEGPVGAQPDLAAALGGSSGATTGSAVRTAQMDPATQARLRTIAANYQRQGFASISDPRGIVLGAREDRNFPLNLRDGTCYVFASLAGAGVSDTDVSVVDGSGSELARDTRSDRDATVEFCPSSAGTYGLRVQNYEGEGPVFVTGWARASRGATTTDASVIDARSTAGATLDENFQLLNSDMFARGYQSYEEPTRGQLGEHQSRRFTIHLEGEKCYAVLAVGDNGVRDLDLVLSDAQGHEIDRDVESDARPIVRVCPQNEGDVTIEVRMARGQGSFIYSAYRWPRGTHGPFGLSGLIWVRVAEVTSLLAVEGYQPSEDIPPDTGRLPRQGAHRTQTLRLPGGHCYSVLAVGGDGVHDLGLTLSSGGTELATDGTHNAFPSVRFCTQTDGRYDLRVDAEEGAGEYFYQVFELNDQGGAY